MKIAALLSYSGVYSMGKLKLYIVDADYVKYLYGFDNRVMFWDGENYKTDRKYIGVVLNINGFNYFAPLSSPKDNDYFYVKGEKKIKKNNIPIIRLVTDDDVLLGKIKLGNMIPVKDDYITLYDIEGEPDKKYKGLVKKEMLCIRKSKEEIIKNASVLYNQKLNNYEGISYLDATIDFKVLEEACNNYMVDLTEETQQEVESDTDNN